jgi:hypothetical protein
MGGSPSVDPGSVSAGLGSASASSAAPVVPFRATAQVETKQQPAQLTVDASRSCVRGGV